MLRPILLLTLVFSLNMVFSQTIYSGLVSKHPIDMIVQFSSYEVTRAIYTYTNFDEPIILTGEFENNLLTLSEKSKQGKVTATFKLKNFDERSPEVVGAWTDLYSGKQLSVTLKKVFALEVGDSIEWKNKEILQPVSLRDRYFKLVVSKKKEDYYPRVTGIKIIRKLTDQILQSYLLDCQLMGLENMSLGDYNFDGFTDFSVFEGSGAGANTTALYFLFDKRKNKFVASGFSGISLTFDSKAKRIYEHSQCCAGTISTFAEYKLVHNKMKLVRQRCFKLDEKTQELVERKMKECQ